jgi:hypothetical protein
MDKHITPDPADYRRAVKHLSNAIRAHRSTHPVARLVESLRLEYYELSARILEEQRQVIDCYAGWASAQIAPDGHVWGCCVRAESIGNVRDHAYDFRAVWFGPASRRLSCERARARMRVPAGQRELHEFAARRPSLARVAGNMVRV